VICGGIGVVIFIFGGVCPYEGVEANTPANTAATKQCLIFIIFSLISDLEGTSERPS
jgi:hypothetical protein